MGHRERCDAQDKAIRQGKNAFNSGFNEKANPYKISPWGMGAFWLCGWNDAKHNEQKPNEG